MIQINNHDIQGIYNNSKTILAVYSGVHLVWSKINELISCFSNGYWIDEYPWLDDASWTD